jgi:hypothetical protein
MDDEMAWCTRCGRPEFEIIESSSPHCDGLSGITHHVRYLLAKKEFHDLFDPIFNTVMETLNA